MIEKLCLQKKSRPKNRLFYWPATKIFFSGQRHKKYGKKNGIEGQF
jgi:hypothetical protein